MRKVLTLLAITAMMVLSSCKEDSDDGPAFCNSDWDIESEAEYDALLAAYNAYVLDMSVAKCNAYKAAFVNYLDAIEPFLECTAWSTAELNELRDVINQARSSMNQLNCE